MGGIWLISTNAEAYPCGSCYYAACCVASQPLDINVEVTVNGVKIPISQNPIAEASSGSSSGTKAGAFTLWPANQTSPQAGAKAGAFTLWPGKAGAKAGAFTLWPEEGSGSGPGIFRKPWHDLVPKN